MTTSGGSLQLDDQSNLVDSEPETSTEPLRDEPESDDKAPATHQPTIGKPGGLIELLWVAAPLIMSNGMVTLTHVVDRLFLTWYSTDAMAAAMPAGMMQWTLMSLPLGTAMYVNTFVAQYEGADDRANVTRSLWQGVYLSIVAGLLLLAFIPFAPWMFASFGHSQALMALEVEYFSILCLGAGPYILATTLSCFYSGRGKTDVIFQVNIATTLVNIVLDWLLIFGIGWFPELGIRGAAIATVTAYCVQLALFAGLLIFTNTGHQYEVLKHWRLNRDLMTRLLRYGLPNGFNFFVEVICFSLVILLIGQESEIHLAAASLTFTLNSFVFIPLSGMGTAVMTLVGQRIGEKQPSLAVSTIWWSLGCAAVYVAAWATAFLLVPTKMLYLFSSFSDTQDFDALEPIVIYLLQFVACYSIFDAMGILFSSAIRGAGDTRFVVVFVGLSGMLIMVVPTFISYRYFDGGITFAFCAVTAFLAVFGLGCMARFLSGRWKTMSVIH